MSFFDEEPQEAVGLDDWLMSYADMITLIVSFFALLLAMSVPKTGEMKQAEAQVTAKFAAPKSRPAEVSQIEAAATLHDGLLPGGRGLLPEALSGDDVSVQDDGQRITTINLKSSLLFKSGDARMDPRGAQVLGAVVEQLLKPEYNDYRVMVEGHTDDTPIHSAQFPSNWELSTARAAAVVRYFIDLGMDGGRLSAMGLADTRPLLPNHDPYGNSMPENQRQNRRVVIRLEKISTP